MIHPISLMLLASSVSGMRREEHRLNHADSMHVDEHSPVHLLDKKGRKSPQLTDPALQKHLWHVKIYVIIMDQYRYLTMWHAAQLALHTVIQMLLERVKNQEELDAWVEAVASLKDLLDMRLIKTLAPRLPHYLVGSPPVRGMFVCDHTVPEEVPLLEDPSSVGKDYLIWLCSLLWSREGLGVPHIVVREMARVTQQDKDQKYRITPLVAQVSHYPCKKCV